MIECILEGTVKTDLYNEKVRWIHPAAMERGQQSIN